jgi:hypothetical protein
MKRPRLPHPPARTDQPDDDQPVELAGLKLSDLRRITPPPSLVPAVMQRIAEPRPVSFWSWLRQTRRLELRISPLGALFVGAAAALALFAVSLDRARVGGASAPVAVAPSPAPASDTVLVRFVLSARGARNVAVAGDFNAWDPQQTVLVDSDGQGTFVATVPVRRGQHEYMFLVDGKWMTDPGAPETRPDGFGRANAILRL